MRVHSVHNLIKHRLSVSTRAFNARGSKTNRCVYCQVEQKYCICEYQPDVNTGVAALLLMSESEVLKPSNTGRLIADVVKDTYAYQWNRTSPDKELIMLLSDNEYSPVLVFPSEYVENKERVIKDYAPPVDGKKLLLVFIDANWREARKIFRKSPYLADIPVLSVKPESVSEYIMRKSGNENHLSTAEVASMVLEMAGETCASDCLKKWFELFRESYLLSKTRLKPDMTRPALQEYQTFRE